MTHTRILAVANQKGGVGKSTTAVSLGAALAELGHRVLVVDLDPQGNASTGLGIRHETRATTVYDLLASDAPIAEAIVPTPLENLYAIPSTIDLAGAEIELVSQFSRELRLRRALEPLVDGDFAFVLLDCPPSLGLLTVNALAAAQELIVPIQCEYYALEGLGQLLRNVRLVQQNVNPDLRLTGIVMTMFDPRTKLSEQVVDEVRRYFGDLVYEAIIPRTVRLSEAPGYGRPITVYDPKSRGAECYRDLAREVATRPPPAGPLPVMEEAPSVAVPAPEPHATSAPRPLVRQGDLEEGLEGAGAPHDGRDEVQGAVPAPAFAPTAGERSAEIVDDAEPAGNGEIDAQRVGEVEATQAQGVEPDVDLGSVPGSEPTTGAGGATPGSDRNREDRPSAETEGAWAEVHPGSGAGSAGDPLVEGEADRPAVDEQTSGPVVRDDDARPPAQDTAVDDTAAEDTQVDEMPAETPKRRWGLFRRGGR